MEFLNDMALFVEVVKARSFRGAADIIGMPNSTLSRRISALEKMIGLRLLHRTTRKITLTEAGQIYFERCKRIVDEAKLAHEQLGEMLEQPSGVLRASLPVDFAVAYMTPLIAEFARLYPGIVFDFDLTSRRIDLVSEPFDVAIRIGEPDNTQLIARPLGVLPVYLYASPRYIERAGEPVDPAELARHECLGLMKTGTWILHDGEHTAKISIGSRFTLNSVGMICRLATLDMGIIMMMERIVADDLSHGRLRRVLSQWYGTPVSVYAVTETRLLPAKTQYFIKFLQEHLSKV